MGETRGGRRLTISAGVIEDGLFFMIWLGSLWTFKGIGIAHHTVLASMAEIQSGNLRLPLASFISFAQSCGVCMEQFVRRFFMSGAGLYTRWTIHYGPPSSSSSSVSTSLMYVKNPHPKVTSSHGGVTGGI
jgi:hypothetical protein